MGDEELVVSLPDFKDYRKDKESDYYLAEELWSWLDEADIVVGHNIAKFDIPWINARLLYHGFMPPSPYKIVDTLACARTKFKLVSNKLQYLATYLKLDGKLDTGGFELWIACMNGDTSAWKKMIEYCMQDVVLVEDVYHKLLPWISNHPNMGLYRNERVCCNCGGSSLKKMEKTYKTNVQEYDQYRCGSCGHINRERRRKQKSRVVTSCR